MSAPCLFPVIVTLSTSNFPLVSLSTQYVKFSTSVLAIWMGELKQPQLLLELFCLCFWGFFSSFFVHIYHSFDYLLFFFTSIALIFSSFSSFVHIHWSVLGEACLAVLSVLDAGNLFLSILFEILLTFEGVFLIASLSEYFLHYSHYLHYLCLTLFNGIHYLRANYTIAFKISDKKYSKEALL